jgi:hypothetical protein
MSEPAGAVRFRRSDRVLSRRVGADVLVTIPGDEDVHELSGSAIAVWAVLETPRTLTELVGDLADAHAAQPAEIADDVEGCLLTLMAHGVVEEVPDLHG